LSPNMQGLTGIVLFFFFGATFCLPFPQDFVILEAEPDFVIVEAGNQEDRQGRVLVETPVDNSQLDQANFRLPLPGRLDEELGAVIVEVAEFDDSEPGFQDIPRDRSGPNQAGFRLPLPESDAFIVEAGAEDLPAIPTDKSAPGVAGFRLPLSADAVADDNIVFDVDIPTDTSREGKAGFRLPKPDLSLENGRAIIDRETVDFVVIEAAANDDQGRSFSDIPRDHSGLKKAGFKLPLPDDQVVSDEDFAAVVVEVGPSDRQSKAIEDIIPRDESGPSVAGFRLPL